MGYDAYHCNISHYSMVVFKLAFRFSPHQAIHVSIYRNQSQYVTPDSCFHFGNNYISY